MLLDCIIDITHALEPRDDYADLEKTSSFAIRTLCRDMCGSVPFHLGTRTPTSGDIHFPPLDDQEGDAVHRQAALVHGWYLIVLPVSRITNLESVPEDQHAWAVSQYERICAIIGQKNHIPGEHVAQIFETAVPAFASALPIHSRHLR